ncbi:unnamed protein product [Musa acuminata subsp. burmannicoides]
MLDLWKYFKCGELGYHFNEYRTHKTVNLTNYKDDFEEEGDAQDDTIDDIDNVEIAKEGEYVACVIKRLLLILR